MHRKAHLMRISDKCRGRAQIADECARDDHGLVRANAIGIGRNNFQALGSGHLWVGQIAAVGGAALFFHQLDQPQFRLGPQCF